MGDTRAENLMMHKMTATNYHRLDVWQLVLQLLLQSAQNRVIESLDSSTVSPSE